jgi:hypothetical protein
MQMELSWDCYVYGIMGGGAIEAADKFAEE